MSLRKFTLAKLRTGVQCSFWLCSNPQLKNIHPQITLWRQEKKSVFKLPSGRIVNTFCRSKRNRFFTSAFRIENKKTKEKSSWISAASCKDNKIATCQKKSMLGDSKRNCSHVNVIQLQSTANILPILFTNIFLPALQGYTLYLKGSYTGYDC